MKQYQTSKEILESCGDKYKACAIVISNIIDILESVDSSTLDTILPDLSERIKDIEDQLNELNYEQFPKISYE